MTDQELRDIVARLAINSIEINKEFKSIAKESRIRQAKLDKEISSINDRYGITQANLGALTEEFFFKALSKIKQLGDIKYDDVEKHWSMSLKGINAEYDIVMINGNSVAIVEVKNKGHINDLIKLKEKMAPRFKGFFKDYKDYDLYSGFASFFVTDEMKEYAAENGIYILERNGDIMETTAKNIVAI